MKRSDIEYVLEALGGDGSYKVSGNHLMTNCINASWGHSSGEDRSKKMGVLQQPGTALVNCFYPGCLHGTLFHTVRAVGGRRVADGLMTQDEVDQLAAFVMLAEDDDLDGDTPVVSGRDEDEVPSVPYALTKALGTGSPYFLSRGVTPAMATRWQLGEADGRALIPLYHEGKVIAMQGRLLPTVKVDAMGLDAKYVTYPTGFKKANYLFGAPLVPATTTKVLLVEGPLDAMMLQDWLDAAEPGVWFVAATLGAKVSDVQQALALHRVKDELVLGFDGDPEGRVATKQVSEALWRRGPLVTVVSWSGKDATDSGETEALQAIRAREPWLVQRLQRALKTAVAAG